MALFSKISKKRSFCALVALLLSIESSALFARSGMSGAGAGILGGTIGFMGGAMIANAANSRSRSQQSQPVVYQTVDQRPLTVRHEHYYDDKNSDTASEAAANNSSDESDDYEYVVVKRKKQ